MRKRRATPDYSTLKPASGAATRAAQGASRKRDTKPELLLRRALWAKGLRYRVASRELPGKPDVVFPGARVVVFVDGDFWHGRDLRSRLAKLQRGHNAPYWVAKISTNVARDRRHDSALTEAGWTVLRFWETDIAKGLPDVVGAVEREIRGRSAQTSRRRNGWRTARMGRGEAP